MKILFSNVFGNYEALEVFSKSIQCFPTSSLYCLGDVVSYGPNPFECFQYVNRETKMVLTGEDRYVFFESSNYEPSKHSHVSW